MAENHLPQINRILEKLNSARDKDLQCFGSRSHRFHLKPTLNDDQLTKFEADHNIQLPSGYRSFLKNAGNGGAGPYYGIYSLDAWHDFASWVDDKFDPENYLSLSCPLHPEMKRNEDWEKQFNDFVSPYQGTISIGTQGCTYITQLIVSGKHKGRLLYLDANGNAPFMIADISFLNWYERWLDELLAGHDLTDFGYLPLRTEAELLLLAKDRNKTIKERSEAIKSLKRLPSLSSNGKKSLIDFLDEKELKIVAVACKTIRRLEIPVNENRISPFLNSKSPEIRIESLNILLKSDPEKWKEEISEICEKDENEAVCVSAYFALEKFCKLENKTLFNIIKFSPHQVLRHHASSSIRWDHKNLDFAISLLVDQNERVRFHSAIGLKQISRPRDIEKIIQSLEIEKDPLKIDSLLLALSELGGEETKAIFHKWTECEDDFHKLFAIDGLCKLNDESIKPMAINLRKVQRHPKRKKMEGLVLELSNESIGRIVLRSLHKFTKQTRIRKKMLNQNKKDFKETDHPMKASWWSIFWKQRK